MGTHRKDEEERRNQDHFFKPPAVDAVGPSLPSRLVVSPRTMTNDNGDAWGIHLIGNM